MATKNTAQDNAKSSTLLFIKGARVLTYFVHGFALAAVGFLSTSFVLLIFSANAGNSVRKLRLHNQLFLP